MTSQPKSKVLSENSRNMGVDRNVISELIKRQVTILGRDITMSKVKNVPGIQVDSNGEIVSLQGDPQIILTDLINQFVELSGLIVKKTMESILAARESDLPVEQVQIPAAQPSPPENLNKALNVSQ